jgi:hypothetical protein
MIAPCSKTNMRFQLERRLMKFVVAHLLQLSIVGLVVGGHFGKAMLSPKWTRVLVMLKRNLIEITLNIGFRYGRTLTAVASLPTLRTALKTHPISSEPRRIQADVQQAQPLVHKLDTEKRIGDNISCSSDHNKTDDKSHNGSVGPTVIIRGLTSVKGLEGVELLSTLIKYLWRIDGVDYYSRIEPNEAKGFRHVRPERTGHEETGKSGSECEKKLDSFWKGKLNGQYPLEVIAAKEKIDAAAIEVLDPYVIKIRNEKYGWKYGCGAKDCTKFFMLLNLCTNI